MGGIVPNNSYLRSTKRERQLVNEARANGFISGRTAGSHSPFDLFIWNPKLKTVEFIQVKTKRGARMKIIKHKEVMEGCVVITSTVSWE